MTRRLPILIVVASLASAFSGCGGTDDATAARSTTPAATPVAAIEIQPRDLSRRLSVSGTVEPRVVVRLASRTSGSVARVLVEEGEAVKAGQLLAQLDMSEAQAELARARAEEESARLDFRRAEELRSKGVVSTAQFEAARATLQVAQSEQALWRTRVEFGRITAPLQAVVTARHIEPGEAVEAQDTLFELAALDELVIRLGVSELDVVHLQAGNTVPITLDALPALDLKTTIRRIFPIAQPGSRLVTVELSLPANALELGVRPGFLARATMMIDKRPDAIVVPAASVGLDEERSYVYLIADGVLERRHIQTGITRGQWTEVVQGLSRGETVLASNPIEMRDGQAVRVVSMQAGAR